MDSLKNAKYLDYFSNSIFSGNALSLNRDDNKLDIVYLVVENLRIRNKAYFVYFENARKLILWIIKSKRCE
jgi:hypothetical protein